MDDTEEGATVRLASARAHWHTALLILGALNLTGLVVVGWLTWQAREDIGLLSLNASETAAEAESPEQPDWAARIENSADEAARQAREAAAIAEEAKEAAQAACREAAEYSFSCP